MAVHENIWIQHCANTMLRRVFGTLQRSNFIENLTRSFLACPNTQKVHYHPAITCWREIELDKNPFYDKYKDKLQHVIRWMYVWIVWSVNFVSRGLFSNVRHNDDDVGENKHSNLDNKTATMVMIYPCVEWHIPCVVLHGQTVSMVWSCETTPYSRITDTRHCLHASSIVTWNFIICIKALHIIRI